MKKLVRPALKIAISCVLIAVVLRAFDVRGVAAQIARVDAISLVLTVFIGLCIAPLHAARWYAVMKAAGTELGFRTALELVFIGHFFNQVLPSSVGGDAVRVWCARRAGMRFAAAANSVIMDRALTLVSLLLLSAATIPWLFDRLRDPAARWALSSVIISGIAGFCAFVALQRLPHFIAGWRITRALLVLAKLGRTTLFSPHLGTAVVLLSVASFLGCSLIVYCIAAAMQLNVTLFDCVLLVPPVILISVLPVSIAGWGVREGAMVVAFGFIGVPASAAFAVSVLFGLSIAAASLPGSLLWWLGGYSLRRIAEAEEAKKQNPD